MATFTSRLFAAVVVGLFLGPPARGAGTARAKIVRAGKAATALVQVQGQFQRGQASAFCLHPSGIFLTNAHVVDQGGNVTLVLNAGLANVKTLPARVLRTDKDLDLALLKVDGQKDLPSLPLGSDEELGETDEVVAFGYPFGQLLTPNQKEYPAISVNVGKVTSMRMKDGQLHRIQLDAVLNPGNSGGPVLDRDGKVVGVVVGGVTVSGVSGTGINFAIPVRQVVRFVSRPEIFFEPPALTLAAVHEPVTFQARAVELVPSAKTLDLQLVLGSEHQPSRTFPMTRKDGSHQAAAVPVPRAQGPALLRLTALYPEGSVKGLVRDQTIRVGGRAVKFSGVRRLLPGPRARVVLHDGKSLPGELAGVTDVPVRLGRVTLPLDLTRATEVRVEPPADLSTLTGTVVARREGKEVGRLTRFLRVQGVARPGEEEVLLNLEVAPLEKDVVERTLRAPVRDVAVGGGGRYLILHLPRVSRLAVFDVNQAKVVKHLPAPDANLKMAAGLDRLVVALPGSRTLQRWNLHTFRQELAVPYPDNADILALSLGSATRGPVVVFAKEGSSPWPVSFLLSLDRLERHEIGWARTNQAQMPVGQAVHVRSSPDGKATGVWSTSQIPTGVQWIQWDHQVAKGSYLHNSNGYVVPGWGGKVLYTGRGMFTGLGVMPQQSKSYPGTDPNSRYLPASVSDYYLDLGSPGVQNRFNPQFSQKPRRVFAVRKLGLDQPLLEVSGVDVPNDNEERITGDFTLDKRFHLVPQAKLLVVIPAGNDRLILHRIDVEEALRKLTAAKK